VTPACRQTGQSGLPDGSQGSQGFLMTIDNIFFQFQEKAMVDKE